MAPPVGACSAAPSALSATSPTSRLTTTDRGWEAEGEAESAWQCSRAVGVEGGVV
jgi:hypothetical protein